MTGDFFGMELRVPRTEDELAVLLRERPGGWEYLLYAAVLLQQRDRLEEQYRDHLLRHAPLAGDPLDAEAASRELKSAFPDALGLIRTLMELFNPEVHERSFGALGAEGDEALIRQLARRTMDGYAEFMDWEKRLRGARVPADFQDAFRLAAELGRNPVEELRSYVDEIVSEMDRVPELLKTESEKPIAIEIELVLTIDEEAQEAFTKEVERLGRRGLLT